MCKRIVLRVVAILMLASVAAWAQAAKQENSLTPELERVRAALERYKDPIVAIHDGYLSSLGCADFPHPAKAGHEPYPQGAMGIHFFNPALVGPELDPMRPQILLYEPENGKMRLVGAEWFVPAAIAGDTAPELFGHMLWGPMEGHEPLMPGALVHYDLHVWLFRDNPEGLFAPTIPAVKCTGYPYQMEMESTKIASQTAKR